MAADMKKSGRPQQGAPDVYETISTLREEVGRLRQRVTELEAERAQASQDVLAVLQEASALLQRGVTLLQKSDPPVSARQPEHKKTVAPPLQPPRPAGPPIAIPVGKGNKQSYTASQLKSALEWNDMALIDRVRDSIARLAVNNPEQEARILTQIREAGLPTTVFSGPLRPAIIDGSNIANMSPERRAHLAYITQIRRAAWSEGYFPVLIIVDASLRYQIDHPDHLLAMVERGEVRMADAGSPADRIIIDEAARQHAVIITNDRLNEWPEAKTLEKRHAVLQRGVAGLGSFHRSDMWFY